MFGWLKKHIENYRRIEAEVEEEERRIESLSLSDAEAELSSLIEIVGERLEVVLADPTRVAARLASLDPVTRRFFETYSMIYVHEGDLRISDAYLSRPCSMPGFTMIGVSGPNVFFVVVRTNTGEISLLIDHHQEPESKSIYHFMLKRIP